MVWLLSFQQNVFIPMDFFFKCFRVLKVTHNFEGNVKRVLGSQFFSLRYDFYIPCITRKVDFRTFFTHLFLNMVPCWEGTYPAEGREKATSLPSVFSDSERATTSTTPGVHGVQGQWPPWDFLSPLTSTCLQTPWLAAEPESHCIG